jgi:hypothetical protein
MKFAGCAAIGNASDLIDRPVVAGGSLFGVLNDLVNEVAKVQHEAELIRGTRAFVFEDHPAISVKLSFINVLAAHEGEIDRRGVSFGGCGDGAADSTPGTVLIRKPIPINRARFEPSGKHTAGPIRIDGDERVLFSDDAPKRGVLCDLDSEFRGWFLQWRATRPQNHAMRVGIARGHALGKEITSLLPGDGGCTPYRRAPKERGPTVRCLS